MESGNWDGGNGKKSASFELAARTDWALALPLPGRLLLGSGRLVRKSGLIRDSNSVTSLGVAQWIMMQQLSHGMFGMNSAETVHNSSVKSTADALGHAAAR